MFLLILSSSIEAQVMATSSQTTSPADFQNIGFRQEFNTYLWHYQINTQRLRYKKWHVVVSERFNSSMLRLRGQNFKWKDDQNFNFTVNYSLWPALTLVSRIVSLAFLDRQSGLNNDIRTHSGAIGVKYSPRRNVFASAEVGPKWDHRLNQHDYGTHYRVDVAANRLDWEGYNNSLSAALGQDVFAVRRNNNFYINYLVSKEFVPGTSDTLRTWVVNRRRDNYASVAGDIESLRESVKALDNSLLYQISRDVNFGLNSVIQFKNVELISLSGSETLRQRKRNDQSVHNTLSLNILKKRFKSHINLSYWSQTQRYDINLGKVGLPFSRRTAFITPDNESNRLRMSTDLSLKMTPSDSLFAYFSISRFMYDTPDTNNFDDRDELRINSRLLFYHSFNPSLKLELEANVNLYHLVYIFGERSADNNWNRIFRLRPAIVYQPAVNFRLKQAFEVLANYVDYDFEDPNVLTKSFVFRKFALDDSLRWRFGYRTSFILNYRLQLEENGQLSWEQWLERVLVTRQSHWLRIYLRYDVGEKLILSPGLTYYGRTEWRHKTDPFGVEIKEKSAVYSSFGPILQLHYMPSRSVQFVLDSMRQAVDGPTQERYYINNIDLHLNWYF